MTTSRPLVEGDAVICINSSSTGEPFTYVTTMTPSQYILKKDFGLPVDSHDRDIIGQRVFGLQNWRFANDPRLLSAIRRGTAPALYVREGDTVEPWTSYRTVLFERRMRALTERHQGLIAQLRLHGAGNIQLRVEDDVVVIRCSSSSRGALEGFAAEGVRIEITDAARSTLPSYTDLEAAITADLLRQYLSLRDIPLDTSASVVAAFDIPPPTRFNLLECDLPAVAPPPAKQKNFDALAELQAEFRAARVAAKTTVQPVLTRFDLLECDEPAEPVSVKPKWSAPQRPQQQPHNPQPTQQQRRTVEDILDLTTSGPLEALAALQIVKAEIARDLWQKETN